MRHPNGRLQRVPLLIGTCLGTAESPKGQTKDVRERDISIPQ